ncbi:hypothetical protein B0H14DRAFT_3141001 [Mycena olivaceomarginata]|nr:hypothetical protein B0H14DRAFT_3141001 [Mycena olivaceomarginata]
MRPLWVKSIALLSREVALNSLADENSTQILTNLINIAIAPQAISIPSLPTLQETLAVGMDDVPGGVTVGPAPQVIPSVPTLQETLAEAKPVPVESIMVVGPLTGVQVTPSNPTLQATGPPAVPTVGPVMVEVPSTQMATPSVPTLYRPGNAGEITSTEPGHPDSLWTPVTNAFYVMAKRTRFHQGYPVESKYRSGGYAGPTVAQWKYLSHDGLMDLHPGTSMHSMVFLEDPNEDASEPTAPDVVRSRTANQDLSLVSRRTRAVSDPQRTRDVSHFSRRQPKGRADAETTPVIEVQNPVTKAAHVEIRYEHRSQGNRIRKHKRFLCRSGDEADRELRHVGIKARQFSRHRDPAPIEIVVHGSIEGSAVESENAGKRVGMRDTDRGRRPEDAWYKWRLADVERLQEVNLIQIREQEQGTHKESWNPASERYESWRMLRFSAYNATGEETRLVLELEVWGAACRGPRIRRKERRKLGEPLRAHVLQSLIILRLGGLRRPKRRASWSLNENAHTGMRCRRHRRRYMHHNRRKGSLLEAARSTISDPFWRANNAAPDIQSTGGDGLGNRTFPFKIWAVPHELPRPLASEAEGANANRRRWQTIPRQNIGAGSMRLQGG